MKPCNRFLLIEPIEEKEGGETSQVLLPESFKKKSLYISAKVIDTASDCKIEVKKNQIVLVDNSMVQEVEINEKTNYLVLENYILGILDQG